MKLIIMINLFKDMILEVKTKVLIIISMSFNLLFFGQKISIEDIQMYNNGKEKFVLYNNKKFSGRYFQNIDTLEISTNVSNGIIKKIEEKGLNYKALFKVYKSGKMYKKIYNNGKLISEGLFNSNYDKNGKWTSYYINGAIRSIENYNIGKKIGKWKYYDPNGIVLKTISFKNEVPFPSSKEINGNILSIGNLTLEKQNCKENLADTSFQKPDYNCEFIYYYKNSKYTGYAIYSDEKIFFIEQGKAVFVKVLIDNKISEFSYVNDKLERNGDYLEFLLNGEIKIRGNYKNGYKSGDWVNYYDSGRIKSKERYYFNKPKDWWFYYSELGDNTKIEIYSDGKLKTIGKPVYEAKNSKYFDINTVFYDAVTNKALYQKKERHFRKNGYVYPLEYKEL
ncbi:hypothetical protein DBR39_01830 [Chryseobacterium sp. KBW03]|uniref:toxin-antitoxin system YwqK family antitoxin n=1 Tax=Chryseobacterium sp. KBW03 TaxID=2153362 RepID=UPI000F5A228D|nr:hypothetical protein [Chryseobacterium sp. KBW03]RQO42639.1 hypothetical protein DBR39_01830 [Chryseobacterium sp. KBW03]